MKQVWVKGTREDVVKMLENLSAKYKNIVEIPQDFGKEIVMFE